MGQAESTDRIEAVRRRFHAFLADGGAGPATRRWVAGLFERGLKIADELEVRFGSLAGRRVLEIGTAWGGDLAGLYSRGACCTGSDKFEFKYADLRRRLAAKWDLTFVRCDGMTRWPFADGSFDLVMAMEVVELVEDLDGFFGEMTRVLKPGGIGLVETGVTLRMLRRDPIYGLPLIAALPNRLRRFVAERIFRRGSDFRVSNHNFHSAYKFRSYARRRGYEIWPLKFADSPIINQVARWPFSGLWQHLIRHFAFDFVLIVPPATAAMLRRLERPTRGRRPILCQPAVS